MVFFFWGRGIQTWCVSVMPKFGPKGISRTSISRRDHDSHFSVSFLFSYQFVDGRYVSEILLKLTYAINPPHTWHTQIVMYGRTDDRVLRERFGMDYILHNRSFFKRRIVIYKKQHLRLLFSDDPLIVLKYHSLRA